MRTHVHESSHGQLKDGPPKGGHYVRLRTRAFLYFPGSRGGSILHGDGFHFDASRSSLKCVLVMNGSCRYFGSSTTVRTRRMTSPFGSGPTLSKYSVMFAFALYGTPFLRR